MIKFYGTINYSLVMKGNHEANTVCKKLTYRYENLVRSQLLLSSHTIEKR